MPIITDGPDSPISPSADDSWDGFTIAPYELDNAKGFKLVAVTNRDIAINVAGIAPIPADSLTIAWTENITALHGASRGKPYALPGGDQDCTYTIEFGGWIDSGAALALEQALFAGPNMEAVYHSVNVRYNGDPAKGHVGMHDLFTIRKAKAKGGSFNMPQGQTTKGKFDGLAVEWGWYGRR